MASLTLLTQDFELSASDLLGAAPPRVITAEKDPPNLMRPRAGKPKIGPRKTVRHMSDRALVRGLQ
jgi:hypothetical protein